MDSGCCTVVLCHNSNDEQRWTEVEMNNIHGSFVAQIFPPKEVRPVHFTFKYRLNVFDPWIWANEALHRGNGELLFQSKDLPLQLSALIRGVDGTAEQQAPDVGLRQLSFPVSACKDPASRFECVRLGVINQVSRHFALARNPTPWLVPRHNIPIQEESIFLACLRNDGLYLSILPLSQAAVTATLKITQSSEVQVLIRNDSDTDQRANILVAIAFDPQVGLRAVVNSARGRVHGNPRPLSGEFAHADETATSLQKPKNSHMFDGLSFCTWNSLGSNLTEGKLLGALEDLNRHHIPISCLLIDDGWQSVDDHRAWLSFEAHNGFPHGLRHTVHLIREKYPQIKYIAVWHAILGYWRGISPDGRIAAKHQTQSVRKTDGDDILIVVRPDVSRLYRGFYDFLTDCGINAVKTDVQCALDDLADSNDRRHLQHAYEDVWSRESRRHFGANAVSCMSLFPQNIFHSLLPGASWVRNSDDYFPNVPASHPWHLFANAYNALFLQALDALPDWDMFQTSHPFGAFHAAARCLSGGPICITDEPANHDLDLIRRLVATSPSGTSIVLKSQSPGTTTNWFRSYHEPHLLRIAARDHMLGLFNIHQCRQEELIEFGRGQLVWESNQQVYHHPCGLLRVSLEPADFALLSAHPMQSLMHGEAAVIGLLDKLLGSVAMLSCEWLDSKATILLKALGILGLYVSNARASLQVTLGGHRVPDTFISRDPSTHLIRIDLETAWRPAECSEIECEILVNT